MYNLLKLAILVTTLVGNSKGSSDTRDIERQRLLKIQDLSSSITPSSSSARRFEGEELMLLLIYQTHLF